jgi:hypothetical protein
MAGDQEIIRTAGNILVSVAMPLPEKWVEAVQDRFSRTLDELEFDDQFLKTIPEKTPPAP